MRVVPENYSMGIISIDSPCGNLINVVLVLNMEDVVKAQGKQVDVALLEECLGIPVISFVAADLKRYNKLKDGHAHSDLESGSSRVPVRRFFQCAMRDGSVHDLQRNTFTQMDREYHQKWFHVKAMLPMLPVFAVGGVLISLMMTWIW